MVATKLEGLAVASFVWNTLNNDAGAGGVNTLLGGRIYVGRVPQAAALPAALITMVASTATNTMGGRRVVERTVVDVHLIADGIDYAALNTVAKRVDTVLQNAAGSNAGVQAVELVKEQTTAYSEDDAGKSYVHVVQTFATPSYVT